MDGVYASYPLVGPDCRATKRHQIIWCGMALCCMTDYSLDPVFEPGSNWQAKFIAQLFRVERAA